MSTNIAQSVPVSVIEADMVDARNNGHGKSSDAEKGALLGGVGGLITGAIAGSAVGSMGIAIGALVGGIVGAVASGVAVAAVDRIDDDSFPGLLDDVTEDHELIANERHVIERRQGHRAVDSN
jgi:phage tail tape-measure protein